MAALETQTIPREEWESFLNRFTEFNAEMPVRVEVLSPDSMSRLLAEHQPLLDLTLDSSAAPELLLVEAGDPAALESGTIAPTALRHVVRQPTALRAHARETLGWDALEVESPDGCLLLTVEQYRCAGSESRDSGGRGNDPAPG